MPLSKLQFKPGIVRETTSYTNEGGWFDCDKVRFRAGLPEKIGGWQRKSNNQFIGSARALHPWVALDGSNFIGVGTNLKYYVEQGGAFNDITPIRAVFTSFEVSGVSATGAVGEVNSMLVEVSGLSATGAVGQAGVVQTDIASFGRVGTVSVEISDGEDSSVPVTT